MATKGKRTLKSTEGVVGVLYWLHDMSHDDVFTQGYVGITVCGFQNRLSQHRSTARKGKYKKDFIDGLFSPTFIGEVLYEGSVSEIRDMERFYRPEINIGWNRAIGGDGGFCFKHGLTKSPIKATYYIMLGKTQKESIPVCPTWVGEDGLEQFAKDMLPIPEKHKLWRHDLSKGYSKDNCKWSTQKEIARHADRVATLAWEGQHYTYYELADKIGIKSNTLQYRLRRGWTLAEALNIDKREKRFIIDIHGNKVPYCGRLLDDEIDEIVDLRLSGHTITEIGEAFDIDSSQVSRICSRLGVKPNE